MCLLMGQAYGIPTVALRLFNVYGARQRLSSSKAGALAAFTACLLSGKSPRIFEDGRQRRDFVHVRDVTQACRLALESPEAAGLAINVGSGRIYTIREVAAKLISSMGMEYLEPEITGQFRAGDVRHCYADITLARKVLGYVPQVPLEDGLLDLVEWAGSRRMEDSYDDIHRELPAWELTM
jgi:dTDP-L-rhamnose 4-epimerase